jgi:flagellum-specific peptidoglycan hydrolase FlgJ
MYKYTIMDYFRKYDHAADSFIDHGKFLQENKNYAAAMQVAGDCNKCIDAIAKGGYSTSPTYAETLKSIARSIHVIAVHAKITPLVPYI